MNIQSKIDHSIKLLKKAESLALMMQPETGYYLAFSGGKDSQCIYHLAKMAGVKFHAVYNVTTLDPPPTRVFHTRLLQGRGVRLPETQFLADLRG